MILGVYRYFTIDFRINAIDSAKLFPVREIGLNP